MKYFVTTKFLQFLLLLAFVVAQISPACAFVSGQVKMQVCASDGSMQTIEVSDQYDILRFINGYSEKTKEKEEHKKKNECAFCFSRVHLTKIISYFSDIEYAKISETYIYIGSGSIAYKSFEFQIFNPRAPPYLIS